nr:hypothetical protein BaRGS_018384 [Batillaria attramentaria]
MEGMRRRIDLSVDPKEVNKGMPLTSLKNGSLEARILYTHPVSKAICLTLLPGIVQSVGREGEEMFADLSVGDVIEDAEVLFVDKELVKEDLLN